MLLFPLLVVFAGQASGIVHLTVLDAKRSETGLFQIMGQHVSPRRLVELGCGHGILDYTLVFIDYVDLLSHEHVQRFLYIILFFWFFNRLI